MVTNFQLSPKAATGAGQLRVDTPNFARLAGLDLLELPYQCECAAFAGDGNWFIQIDTVTANTACGIFVNEDFSPARAVYAPVPGPTSQLSRG